MNAKFEWLGIKVARKHVYFYSLLIVGSLFANTIKNQLGGGESQTSKAIAEMNRVTDQFAVVESLSER
jgi:hypothetical protein